MKMETVELYFQDEVRGIGCGLRSVAVEVGRSWAYLHWHGRRRRLSRETYETLLAATAQYRARALVNKAVRDVRRTVAQG